MARHLYRLGRWSFRRRGTVLIAWVVLLVLAGTGAATLAGKTSDEFSLSGIESTEAFDLIEERTPDAAPGGATARIAFQAPEGETLTEGENQQLVLDTLEAARTGHVLEADNPFEMGTVAEDGRTAYATISYDRTSTELTVADREALESAPQEARDAGLEAHVGGDALEEEIPHGGMWELVGIGVALVVLLLTLGSLLAAGMPLVTALVGVGIGISGITTLSGFVDMGSTAPILALMLGLAVGIDYALFIVSRYRHEVATGRSREEAAGRAVGTAGSAVVFAGLTVIIALTGLSVVRISWLTEMGLAAAGTVAVAVLIALTMLPALFGFGGRRAASGRLRYLNARDPETDGVRTNGRRWAELITKHKAVTLVGGLLLAGVVAVPVASMQLALPDDGTAAEGSGPREAYDLISEEFGAGANGPLMLVVDTAGADDPQGAVERAVQLAGSVEKDVAAVVSPVPSQGSPAEAVQAFEGQLEQAQYATVMVVPESGPSAAETQELVDALRAALDNLTDETGAQALVTGQTAIGVDISESLADALPVYLAVVVGLAFVLLTVVFRSLLVPLKAVAGFLVSLGVALGATVAVFQWGWLMELFGISQSAPVPFILPLLLTGILFGLAMDYEVFLVSRIREKFVHGAGPTGAVVHGFQNGARVVTAAAAIMIAVFATFIPDDDAIIKSIGFGLAVGILADAFLVRMTLVPAFMALVGRRMWWLPRWLDRFLPNLDVEGESLAEPSLKQESEPVDV